MTSSVSFTMKKVTTAVCIIGIGLGAGVTAGAGSSYADPTSTPSATSTSTQSTPKFDTQKVRELLSHYRGNFSVRNWATPEVVAKAWESAGKPKISSDKEADGAAMGDIARALMFYSSLNNNDRGLDGDGWEFRAKLPADDEEDTERRHVTFSLDDANRGANYVLENHKGDGFPQASIVAVKDDNGKRTEAHIVSVVEGDDEFSGSVDSFIVQAAAVLASGDGSSPSEDSLKGSVI